MRHSRPTAGVLDKLSDRRVDDYSTENFGNANFIDNSVAEKQLSKADQRAKRAKKWRIVVRNLPFSVTQEQVYNEFSKHGSVEEVTVPSKKLRGKDEFCAAGYAFVQMAYYPDAYRVLKNMNGVEFRGRTIAIDWAVPKDEYLSMVLPTDRDADLLKSTLSNGDAVPDLEASSADAKSSKAVKRRNDHSTSSEAHGKSPRLVSDVSRDVSEGRSIFVRNLSYNVDNEDLFQWFSDNFAGVEHAVVCRMPGSRQSRGTAFVRFDSKENADKCLAQAADVSPTMDGRDLLLAPALSREQAGTKKNEGPKDKRHMSLLQLTHIAAANLNGMSEADSKKRRKIEMSVNLKLKRSTNFFVSQNRVIIHNLPKNIKEDQQLRRKINAALFDVPGLRLTECRIMRDLNVFDSEGNAQPLGYAFVTFADHSQAKSFIEKWNNNPDVFSYDKRPIIEFSIENIEAIQAKERQLEKSKAGLHRNRNETPAVVTIDGNAGTDVTSKQKHWLKKKRARKQKKI